MLGEALTPDVIRLKVPAKDWEGAVRAAGELLVHTGRCEPRYIQAMIDAVHEIGPYMVLAPGLALAHARPQDGVIATGISLVTLAQPVEFGSEENDPVSLVIAFGSPDKTSHIGLLARLAGFLEDEARRQQLGAAESVTEVIELIRQFEIGAGDG